ncbi:MAG: hypothetical protein EU530_09965 [Promethearchaeota archaeon]|nr:MAG: hypothetical protein EU530_09965 [Candidatus Lokiarchaeota archaeon]
MVPENHINPPFSYWGEFITNLAEKTRSKIGKSRKLKRAISNTSGRPDIYITLGVHGNILFSDIGYCEFDSLERIWTFIQKWAKISKTLPIAFEIGLCSLENFAKTYPVWQLFQDQNVEVLNPTFSQPYLRHIGEESNIRQLKYGMDLLRQNNIPCKIYASSEHALHPQLPQLLREFGINKAFATVRLAGGAPTSFLPKVIWRGLDGSEVQCAVNQSGIPNGQVWHGKFFQELAHLLFSAYSRPDLPYILFENIEDVAYDFKEIPEFAEHKSEFERSNIHFSKFEELISNSHPFSRISQWAIEDFPLREMNSRLITENRICEDKLINFESSISLTPLIGNEIQLKFFDKIWKNVLMAQNHDAYIVPYITPGMYLMSQGLSDQYIPSKLSIEQKSMGLLDLARAQIKSLNKKMQSLKNSHEDAYVNWLWDRVFLVGNKLISIPSCGYTKIKSQTHKFKEFSSKGTRSLLNLLKWVDIPHIEDIIESKEIVFDSDLIIRLEDNYHFQKLKIHTKKRFFLPVKNCEELYITYPFGAERTTETSGHSHRFYWINRKFVLIHSGCPYFTKKGNTLNITVPPGVHEFGFEIANTLKKAYHIAWEFFYPPEKLLVPKSWEGSKSLFSIKFNDFIPTSIQNRNEDILLRGFTIGKIRPEMKNSIQINLIEEKLDSKIKEIRKPSKWKILSFLVKNDW